MSRTGLLAVLLFTALLFLIASLIPNEEEQLSRLDTPWNVTVSPEGNSHLLGITLGKSTLLDAQQQWKNAPEITLFIPTEGEAKVEAYFQAVSVGGIGANIVAEIAVAEAELKKLIDQGARISTQGDGSRKVTLDGDGVSQVEQSSISSLTYLPKANLSTEVIKKRFGLPNETIPVAEHNIEHWLYPRMGLDLVYSEETKEVLQYVPPREFNRLVEPLRGATADSTAPPPS